MTREKKNIQVFWKIFFLWIKVKNETAYDKKIKEKTFRYFLKYSF